MNIEDSTQKNIHLVNIYVWSLLLNLFFFAVSSTKPLLINWTINRNKIFVFCISYSAKYFLFGTFSVFLCCSLDICIQADWERVHITFIIALINFSNNGAIFIRFWSSWHWPVMCCWCVWRGGWHCTYLAPLLWGELLSGVNIFFWIHETCFFVQNSTKRDVSQKMFW